VVDEASPPEGQPQRQQSRFESFVSVVRTLIVRALIIYFITNFFRGKTPTPQTNSTQSGQVRLPASNIYRNGTMFVSTEYCVFYTGIRWLNYEVFIMIGYVRVPV
jgi:hypothetical protein